MKQPQIDLAVRELLDQIQSSSRPANEIINAYTRQRRYIGSKDRQAITTAVWDYFRSLPTPQWLQDLIPTDELNAMRQPAQTILRVNGNRSEVQQKLSDSGVECTMTKLSPWGLILKKRVNLLAHPCYVSGEVEIQDEGSQLLALQTHIQPGEDVLDYCAGAGGKSLAFAQMMHNTGKIVAHDVSAISLKKLQVRAKRAKVQTIHTTQRPMGSFQHVVVDAPCSGSGTWRRCPDAMFKLQPATLKRVINTQRKILDQVVPFVKKGGYLHYMTCSLISSENQDQMRAFLRRHSDFKLVHHTQYTPAKHGTDGFFLATFQRILGQ